MIKKFMSGAILFNMIFFQCNFACSQMIEDDVAIQSFQGKNVSKPVFEKEIIEDETAVDLKGKNLTRPAYKKVLVEDEVIKNNTDIQSFTKSAVHYKIIDENAELVSVPVCAANLITTKNGLKIGQKVIFKVSKDVYKNGEIFIKEGTLVNAFIELISESGRYGDPDEIELGRFSTKDVKGNPLELSGIVRKQGADRGKWAKPLYYAGLSVPLFGAPLLLCYFVKGGKTNIKPEQNFELYYE